MQKVFEQLRSSLIDFVDQREFFMLRVFAPDAEAALMLKLLFDHQSSSSDDLYYLFTEAFVTPDQYVDQIVSRLEIEYSADVTSGGKELNPIPESCLRKSGNSASKRLQECFAYTRGLLPIELGHRVVWAMAPAEISNPTIWENFILGCIPETGIEPWMRGSRWIVRLPIANKGRSNSHHPLMSDLHFSIPANAAEDELRESLNKPIPSDMRAQALAQIAFIDLAHGRIEDASPKLTETLSLGQQLDDNALQTIAMLGLGDAGWRQGNFEKAKYWYECAILPAGASSQSVSLAIIADRLGDIAMQEQNYGDALIYYEQLVLLKRTMLEFHGLVESLLKRSRAEQKLRNAEASILSCHEALLVLHAFPDSYPLEECLSELTRAHTAAGRPLDGQSERSEWTKLLRENAK
jgi:tetratricopeptide (TPR) repeat protein